MARTEVEVSPTNVLDLLAPYPIVLVSTRDNIITVNQIEYFTFEPLRIGVGIAHARYTYELLKDEGEFAINVPGVEGIAAVKTCGKVSGRDRDKFELCGFTRKECSTIRSSAIKEMRAIIECEVEREITFENRTWFIGRVRAARKRKGHSAEDALLCGRFGYYAPGKKIEKRG